MLIKSSSLRKSMGIPFPPKLRHRFSTLFNDTKHHYRRCLILLNFACVRDVVITDVECLPLLNFACVRDVVLITDVGDFPLLNFACVTDVVFKRHYRCCRLACWDVAWSRDVDSIFYNMIALLVEHWVDCDSFFVEKKRIRLSWTSNGSAHRYYSLSTFESPNEVIFLEAS